jgi:hypothetical protein
MAKFTYEYAHYALVTKPGTVPLGVTVAWVSDWVWTTGAIPLLSFGLLLFPDGHLPSPRWRPVAWLGAATLTMFVFGSAFQPGPLPGYPDIPNPVGIDAAGPRSGQSSRSAGFASRWSWCAQPNPS